MPDPRFFCCEQEVGIRRLAELTGAQGAWETTTKIRTAAPLGEADSQSVAFFSDRRRLPELTNTRAAAVFLKEADRGRAPQGVVALVSLFPQAAWAKAVAVLHPQILAESVSSLVHPTARLEDTVRLAPGVSIAQGVHIGSGSTIGAGTTIGPGVMIGRDCEIGANVSIQCALIGDRVRLLAGVRVGEAGFAVADGPQGPIDVPQIGRVVLQDAVTVGANSCIDRGGWNDTVVGENTKIDNLVHIGHNSLIGRNCRLAAFTGISGSVVVGDGVMFGGKAGVADWIEIGPGAAIGAAASLFKNVPAGQVWTGFPARPLRRWLREQATLAKLSRSVRGAVDEED